MTDALIADSVTAKEIPLLWRRRFPLGTLSLIAGRPGSGKSQIALLIASEISKQGLVSIISGPEDDLETVTKPRLDAYKGNQKLIYLADTLYGLPRDLNLLEELILETMASFVVLDPIAAHFDPEGGIHSRRSLRKLIQVAKRTRSAIVGIHHTVKMRSGELIEQVGGSMGGLSGSSRAIYIFDRDYSRVGQVRDPRLPRYTLECVKINGLEEPGKLIFERSSVETSSEVEAPKLRVVEKSYGVEADLVAQASEWLTIFLSAGQDGVRLNGEVRIECQRAGFGWQMMQNLGHDLGFLGNNGNLRWQLPKTHPLRADA